MKNLEIVTLNNSEYKGLRKDCSQILKFDIVRD